MILNHICNEFIVRYTCFLWFISGDNRLSHPSRTAIENVDNAVYLSAASLWEMAIKFSLGKLTFELPFERLYAEILQENNIEILDIKMLHAEKIISLPFHHRDPFDRMLIAQALADHLTLVTEDSMFSSYGVEILD